MTDVALWLFLQALIGMSGIGKTALATAFAKQATTDGFYQNGVFWVNADNATLQDSLKELAVSAFPY